MHLYLTFTLVRHMSTVLALVTTTAAAEMTTGRVMRTADALANGLNVLLTELMTDDQGLYAELFAFHPCFAVCTKSYGSLKCIFILV